MTLAQVPVEVLITHFFPCFGDVTYVACQVEASDLVQKCLNDMERWVLHDLSLHKKYTDVLQQLYETTDVRERFEFLAKLWHEVPACHRRSVTEVKSIQALNQSFDQWVQRARVLTIGYRHQHTTQGMCTQCEPRHRRHLPWLQLRLVCRAWNDAILATPQLWEQFYVMIPFPEKAASLKKVQLQVQQHLATVPPCERGRYVLDHVWGPAVYEHGCHELACTISYWNIMTTNVDATRRCVTVIRQGPLPPAPVPMDPRIQKSIVALKRMRDQAAELADLLQSTVDAPEVKRRK